ncbi:hypothetical protein PHLGIDRAFT_517540 [Phlebiopsis gigantea 11061_1 CR5-6]|uniref:Serine/threonine-protein phosphatase n=1 Tax=Phlebiopsis gigantea (strain 11061_1 CR5-6) TaxID=745531 RepID=A0A0C3RW67_PHLG1|nr:hypothetical protein PHLGIDRAFT_517540 [Phlebiopsis gigantea 11061_1 CR5-6]
MLEEGDQWRVPTIHFSSSPVHERAFLHVDIRPARRLPHRPQPRPAHIPDPRARARPAAGEHPRAHPRAAGQACACCPSLRAQIPVLSVGSQVPPPYAHRPRDDEFYVVDPTDGRTKPNPELVKDHLFHEGRLTEAQTLFILESTAEVMRREPNTVSINSPVTVCGDIHGQFYDLMKVFEVGGKFTETNYLFLGDYVDRGCFGIEARTCLLYLYTLKLWYPSALTLLRGNHECRHLTGFFTFRRECLHKYSPEVYEACGRSFDALPLTALIDGKFFAVHGGISPHLDRISDLAQLDRFMEPPSSGLLCDLLWADPADDYGNEQHSPAQFPPNSLEARGFFPNGVRGCSWKFTYPAVCTFLDRNGLLGVFRGHEVQDAGYLMHAKTPKKKFPSLITVFSAPNYLDVYHNKGAVIKYKNKSLTIRCALSCHAISCPLTRL